jgi:hypothetical protein
MTRVRVGTLRELDALVGKYLTGEVPQTYWEDSQSFLRFESIEEALNALGDPYFQRCFPDGVRLDNELSEVYEFRAYSSDLSLAWEVVERLSGTVNTLRVKREKNRWVAAFGDGASASATAAPVAICLAALQARGIEVDFDPDREPKEWNSRVAA